MRIISIEHPVSKEDITNSVFVYPTDTCYGIGCDALREDLVGRIYDIKGREGKKPLSIMVDSLDMFRLYGVVNDTVLKFITAFLPGDLTLVVPKTEKVPPYLNPLIPTIGIRIPHHTFSLSLVKTMQAPVITSSANISGENNSYNLQDIMRYFNNRTIQPDIVYNGGNLPYNPPSTVIEIVGSKYRVLRQGRLIARL